MTWVRWNEARSSESPASSQVGPMTVVVRRGGGPAAPLTTPTPRADYPKALTSSSPTELVPLVSATRSRVVLIAGKVTVLYWLAAVG